MPGRETHLTSSPSESTVPATSVSTDWFTTTHWTMVLAARSDDSGAARHALEELCRTYWYPLYTYIRRQGYSPEDAQDLAQGFFERVLERNFFGHADREKGRFRAFLLTLLKHYISDQRDRERALKRGGGAKFISLEAQAAEQRYALEPVETMSPDKLFERSWAVTVLGQAEARLRQEFERAEKLELYEQLKDCEGGGGRARSYADIGSRLGMSESAIKGAAFRFRQRKAELVREVIAQTVARVTDIEDEIRYLLSAIVG